MIIREIREGKEVLVLPYSGRENYQFVGQWGNSGINTYALSHREVARVVVNGGISIQEAYHSRKVIPLHEVLSVLSKLLGNQCTLEESVVIARKYGRVLGELLQGRDDLMVDRITDQARLEDITAALLEQKQQESFATWLAPRNVSPGERTALLKYGCTVHDWRGFEKEGEVGLKKRN